MSLIEFKDLPNTDTPINAENLNHNFNELNKSDNYSREEQVIGTWVSGKPLYRKVMIFNTSINSDAENKFAHGIENAEFVRIKEAHIYNVSAGYSLPLPVTLYSSNTSFDHLNIRVDRTYVQFFLETTFGNGWYKVVILEYTKTTD